MIKICKKLSHFKGTKKLLGKKIQRTFEKQKMTYGLTVYHKKKKMLINWLFEL